MPTYKEKLRAWEAYPLFTPRWGLLCMASYAFFFTLVAALFLAGSSSITEISIEFSPNLDCSGDGERQGPRESHGVSQLSSKCQKITMPDNQKPVVVERIEFTVDKEIAGPILMYYELDDFFTNHRRWFKSTEQPWAAKQMRAGSCMPYQKKRTDCTDDPDLSYGPFAGKETEQAIYRLWNPVAMSNPGKGCYLHWSERSSKCLETEGEECKFDIMQNRVHYPCGLSARLIEDSGLDNLYLSNEGQAADETDTVSEKAEDISFETDYTFKFRNLDPEGIFDKEKSTDPEGARADELHGKQFSEILNMNPVLYWYPPTVCADDPLRLIRPKRHVRSMTQLKSGPKCTNYRNFDFTPGANQASCEYPTDLGGMTSLFNGAISTTCDSQIPSPAGWGIENSHVLNWQRIAGLSTFRKLYGRITPQKGKWSQGAKKTVYAVKRLDMSDKAGVSHTIKKKIVFSNANMYGGQNTYIGICFLVVAFISLLIFMIGLFSHIQNPYRLSQITYMRWKDYR